MNTQLTNLFIADNSNRLIDSGHETYLSKRSVNNLSILESQAGNNFPTQTGNSQNSFLIAYLLNWKIENDILRSFKRNNSKSETILVAGRIYKKGDINSLRSGITSFVLKQKIWKKIVISFSKMINYPVRIMVDKFGINKYLSVFMLTSVLLGLLADLILRYGF